MKFRYVQQKELGNLIPGCEPKTSLDCHDPEKLISNFFSHTLPESEKSLLCKGLSFVLPPKRIDYPDFSLQFELLHCDALEFILPSEKRGLLKKNFKDICFSTLNSYNFDNVSSNLTESECKSLKELIPRKSLDIQKTEKGNTVANTVCEHYPKGMTSLLSDNSKFIPLNIYKSKWLNYIFNLEKKLMKHSKTLE